MSEDRYHVVVSGSGYAVADREQDDLFVHARWWFIFREDAEKKAREMNAQTEDARR